jgi:hypothetical protein
MAILARAARQSKGWFSEFSCVSGPHPKRRENSFDHHPIEIQEDLAARRFK